MNSKQVLLDCCLENGAIVAANTDRADYPHMVQSYRYVWPRDAAYICHALEILGCTKEQAAYFRWLSRAEDIETGLLFQNYYTNGRKRWISFQPDQNGSILWVLHGLIAKHSEFKREFLPLVRLLADGLCKVWDKDHFTNVTQDLWEEFFVYPELKTTHTYSLAACSAGLLCAYALTDKKKYQDTAKEMKAKIERSFDQIYLRRFGMKKDDRPDISLLGLVWPFNIIKPQKLKTTVDYIHKNLEKDGMFFRYKYDDYDCYKYQGTDARRGAGTWPIGSFWMSIYYNKLGDAKKAKYYYDKIIENLDKNQNIPEQFFDNNIQVSVKPLAWSHAMQVIAQNDMCDDNPSSHDA